MDEEKQKTKSEKEKKEEQKRKQKKSGDEFKRRYFEFYDDIKISDRQDW